MASVFTRIIDGELPARFVWRDDVAVAFLSINPIRPGHTLVVPRREVDHWLDAEESLLGHLTAVARRVGAGIQAAWRPPRVGVIVAGFEVPHLHVHLYPVYGLDDFDFRNAAADPDPVELDEAARRLRAALREAGHGAHVPAG